MNQTFEISQFRSQRRGDILLLTITDIETGEQSVVAWDALIPRDQRRILFLVRDPLGLLHRRPLRQRQAA